jgi:hypothetical protein
MSIEAVMMLPASGPEELQPIQAHASFLKTSVTVPLVSELRPFIRTMLPFTFFACILSAKTFMLYFQRAIR